MATSYKHYAFAFLALAGVYSAQISVEFLSHDHAARTIAQVSVQATLTQENVLAEIEKHQAGIAERLEKSSAQLSEIESLKDVKKLRELKKAHAKLERDSREENDLFVKNVQGFIAAQDDQYDIAPLEAALELIAEKQEALMSSFDVKKFDVAISDVSEQQIQELKSLVCDQKLALEELRSELTSKIEDLSKLVYTPRSPLFSSDFMMPWTQLQSPFSSMFNPFSFFMGGQMPGMMSPMMGFTQNNFYGQMYFNQYDITMPELQMPVRGPSQAQAQVPAIQEHVPAADVMIPSATRHSNIATEALSF